MNDTTARIDGVDAGAQISEGKLTIGTDETASVYVSAPQHRPLSSPQTHLQVRIVGEDSEATVEMDAGQAEALLDGIESALDFEGEA